jgi:hypothetical protein
LSYPDSVDTRLLALLDNVAWAKRNCSHCNRPLWLVRVNGGYNVAYTSEGRNHLEDCPQYTQHSPGPQSYLVQTVQIGSVEGLYIGTK